jgi:hypothetical protein
MTIRRAVVALACVLASECECSARGALDLTHVRPSETISSTAITHVTLIDVEQGVALADRTIVLKGPRIEAIWPSNEFHPSPETRIIDAAGLFAMPGLCDAHIHSAMTVDLNGKLFIANGVTLVRDTGGMTPMMVGLRTRFNAQGEPAFVQNADAPVVGPFMLVTGNIIDGSPPVWPMFSEVCQTPDEARAAVRKLKGAGVDQIKVYSRLKPEVYAAACDEAHAVGLMPVGHIPNEVDVRGAIAARQGTNEHLQKLDTMIRDSITLREGESIETLGAPTPMGRTYWMEYERVDHAKLKAEIAALKASGMVQVPTFAVLRGICRLTNLEEAQKDPRLAYVPAFSQQFWAGPGYKGYADRLTQMLPSMLALARDLREGGVPMLVGTDLANPFVFAGFSVHDELKDFVGIGFSPAEALQAATILPARFFGVEADHGSIAAGKLANIVLVRANPLDDIANASAIEHVFIAGQHRDRAALDALLEQVRAVATPTKP